MSELHLIRYCAPTLAGLKTGSMFSCTIADRVQLRSALRRLNLRLGKKGVRLIPIRIRNSRALIYVYRPARLERDLQDERTCQLLADRGYRAGQSHCLRRLIQRLEEHEEFPHEIGLFLGYPPEDVRGFISDSGAYKCVGHWKVYGNEERARKTFCQYKKCTSVYARHYAMGKSLECLTVAV